MTTTRFAALSILVGLTVWAGYAAASEASSPSPWAFDTEKLWEITTIGEDKLLRPAEPRVADDGTLFCRDFERNVSYIIGADGKVVGTFAAQGGGEGQVPFYLNCFPAGEHVAICAPDKLHFFTKQGQFVKAVPNNLFVRFPLAFKSADEFWVAPGALGDAMGGVATVTQVNTATGQEATIHSFVLSDDEKKPSGGAMVIGLTPQIKLDFDPQSNRVYFGKNNDTTVFCLSGDGKKPESFSFAGNRQPVSETDKRNHFAKFDIPEEHLAKMITSLPDRMTYYHRLQVVNGLVYSFTTEGFGGNQTGQVVNIFAPDGRHLYTGKIQVEDGWYIVNPDNLQLAQGAVYAVQQNDAGDKKIVKYRVALPGSPDK